MAQFIPVRCGGCDVKIKAPLKYQGKRVNCPQCGYEVRIPVLDAGVATPAAPMTSKAVAPVFDVFEEPRKPSRPLAARAKNEPHELGDDAFLDPKPAPQKKPAEDEFANIDFADYEDYGPVEDYSAPPKASAKLRNDDTPKPVRKKKRKKKSTASSGGGGISIDPSFFGGLALMLIGGGIFVWLWNRGIIWPYAGILCVAGLLGMFKGLLGLGDD